MKKKLLISGFVFLVLMVSVFGVVQVDKFTGDIDLSPYYTFDNPYNFYNTSTLPDNNNWEIDNSILKPKNDEIVRIGTDVANILIYDQDYFGLWNIPTINITSTGGPASNTLQVNGDVTFGTTYHSYIDIDGGIVHDNLFIEYDVVDGDQATDKDYVDNAMLNAQNNPVESDPYYFSNPNNYINTSSDLSDYIQNNTENSYVYKGDFQTSENNFNWDIHDDGSNVHLNFPDVGGSNYVGLQTTGAFMQLYANPNPSNDYLMWTVTENQGADTEINIYEGGTGHNRLWSSGSVRVGGDPESLCSNITFDVDCNTPLTGADLVVEDDIWSGGKLFAQDWSNVSITTSQVSDLSDYWKNDGSSTATNNWDIGSNQFRSSKIISDGNELVIGDNTAQDYTIRFDTSTVTSQDPALKYQASSDRIYFTEKIYINGGLQTNSANGIDLSFSPSGQYSSGQTWKFLNFGGSPSVGNFQTATAMYGVDSTISYTYGGGTTTDTYGYNSKITRPSGGGPTLTNVYAYYIDEIQGVNKWGFYNGDDDLDNRLGGDKSKTYFGTGNKAYIEFDGSDFIINSTTETKIGSLSGTYTGGSAYVCVYNNGSLFINETGCP